LFSYFEVKGTRAGRHGFFRCPFILKKAIAILKTHQQTSEQTQKAKIMDKKEITAWLEGDQDYAKGVELYYSHSTANPEAKVTIFPPTPECERCKMVLRIKLEELLNHQTDTTAPVKKAEPAPAPAAEPQKEVPWYELYKDLDALSFAELKELQKQLGVKSASAKKTDILAALRKEAKKYL